MKSFLAIILAAVMCLSLVACGESNDSENKGSENDSAVKQTVDNTIEEVNETEVDTTAEENNEKAAMYIGKWTDGNTTLTVNEDGTCNLFIKHGYVKGEEATDISRDRKWELDNDNNLLVIDEAEGGYDRWIPVEEDGVITLRREGSTESLKME